MLLSVVSELPRQTGSGADPPPVVSEQPRRRAEGSPLRRMAGDGDRLPDFSATISELRHCPRFAAPDAVVVLGCPDKAKPEKVAINELRPLCLPHLTGPLR